MKYLIGICIVFVLLLLLGGGYAFLFIIPLLSVVVSLYITELLSIKIISEKHPMGRIVFKVFFGILLAVTLLALFWHPRPI